jgi:hypothetical protein
MIFHIGAKIIVVILKARSKNAGKNYYRSVNKVERVIPTWWVLCIDV